MWTREGAKTRNETGYLLRFRSLKEGIWTFEYEQEGYKLYLITRRIDDNDPITPKMNFVFQIGAALDLQRRPIPVEKVKEMVEHIRDAMGVFVTAPQFKNDPPLGRVLFAMNDLPDWSAVKRPFS